MADSAGELPAQEGGFGAGKRVLERGRLGDGAVARLHQLLERLDGGRGGRPGGRRQRGGEQRQQAGVQSIGSPGPACGRPEDRLGQGTDRLGKETGAQRVDDSHPPAGRMQAAMHLPVPFAGCLDHDQLDIQPAQSTFQQPVAGAGVGDAECDLVGQNRDVG